MQISTKFLWDTQAKCSGQVFFTTVCAVLNPHYVSLKVRENVYNRAGNRLDKLGFMV